MFPLLFSCYPGVYLNSETIPLMLSVYNAGNKCILDADIASKSERSPFAVLLL